MLAANAFRQQRNADGHVVWRAEANQGGSADHRRPSGALEALMYRVLRPSPLTRKTSEQVPGADPGVRYHEVTTWPVLGYATSYEEAREKFGGRPVLEEVDDLHYVE